MVRLSLIGLTIICFASACSTVEPTPVKNGAKLDQLNVDHKPSAATYQAIMDATELSIPAYSTVPSTTLVPILAAATTDSREPSSINLPFCNCKKKVEAAEAAKDLIIEERDAKIAELETSLSVYKNSFQYLHINWVKLALYKLNYYQDEDFRDQTRYEVLGTIEYNEPTIEAVKKFQCDYHDRINNDCAKAFATGWITLPEARHAICQAGYQGEDELALNVASWYFNGYVYEQNIRYSYWLLNNLLERIPAKIAAAENGPIKDQLLRTRSAAITQRNAVETYVEGLARIEKLTGEERRRFIINRRGVPGINYSVDQVCPKAI